MSELEWGDGVAGWRLSASLDKTAFQTEERIVVTTVLQNVSNHSLAYGAQGRDFDYMLDCRDAQGQEVRPTSFGARMADNRGEGRFIRAELAAGESLVNEISATRHRDLTLPGTYTITVTREVVPGDPETPRVVSNSIEFEVTE